MRIITKSQIPNPNDQIPHPKSQRIFWLGAWGLEFGIWDLGFEHDGPLGSWDHRKVSVALRRLESRCLDVATDLLERGAASPFRCFVGCRNAVQIVGAERQRDLRELWSVARPIDLDRRYIGSRQTRDGHHLHILVTSCRAQWIEDGRQRIDRLDARELVLRSEERRVGEEWRSRWAPYH